MKGRILSLVAASLLSVSLVACWGKKEDKAPEQPPMDQGAAPADQTAPADQAAPAEGMPEDQNHGGSGE